MKKEIGIVGLGKMGAGLARNLLDKKWRVVGYNRTTQVALDMEKDGLEAAKTLEELVGKLTPPRVIWLMLPAGKVIDDHLFGKDGIVSLLSRDDIVVEGGNSFYADDLPRYKKLKAKSIHYIDVGVSGGPGGARNGACLMIGGDKEIYDRLEPLFKAISKNDAYQFFPGVGAGHFVKMVHNGIEYGMMQALAEGFAVLKASDYNLDLQDATRIYDTGSVIESRLTKWLAGAFEEYGQDLKTVSGSVKHTGEGEWTVKTGKKSKVPVPIIAKSFRFRVDSTDHPSYTGQILSALRNQFGGHAIQ